MTKKKAIYTIDGKPAKLSDIRSETQDATLKKALGDYISARDVRETSNAGETVGRFGQRRLGLLGIILDKTY